MELWKWLREKLSVSHEDAQWGWKLYFFLLKKNFSTKPQSLKNSLSEKNYFPRTYEMQKASSKKEKWESLRRGKSVDWELNERQEREKKDYVKSHSWWLLLIHWVIPPQCAFTTWLRRRREIEMRNVMCVNCEHPGNAKVWKNFFLTLSLIFVFHHSEFSLIFVYSNI